MMFVCVCVEILDFAGRNEWFSLIGGPTLFKKIATTLHDKHAIFLDASFLVFLSLPRSRSVSDAQSDFLIAVFLS